MLVNSVVTNLTWTKLRAMGLSEYYIFGLVYLILSIDNIPNPQYLTKYPNIPRNCWRQVRRHNTELVVMNINNIKTSCNMLGILISF